MELLHPYNDTDNFDKIAEFYSGGYAWAIACVFLDKTTGRLYGDSMGGCSCYGPWEQDEGAYYCPDYNGLGDLFEITHVRDAAGLLKGLNGEDGPPTTTERRDFCRKVELALSNQRSRNAAI